MNWRLQLFSLPLLVGMSVQAQIDNLVVKGHSLGETLQQFVEKSTPETKARISQCQSSLGPECQDISKLLAEASDEMAERLYVPCKQKFHSVWCQEDLAAVYFYKGKLAEIDVRLFGSWDELRETLISKFGNLSDSKDQVEQNAYGATAHTVRGFWSRNTYGVVASEWVDSDFNRSVFVRLETPQFAREEIERERQMHSKDLD